MTTTQITVAALVVGALSLLLFVLSLQRLLRRQADAVVSVLQRYDERLAAFDARLGSFAQSLNDALAELPAAVRGDLEAASDAEPMMRMLEQAKAATRSHGALALLTDSGGESVVATVGLTEAETNHVARMGFPDYRGARAIEVSFPGDIAPPEGEDAIRSGLVVPLLGDDQPHSLLSVLTRDGGRRYSEDDVAALSELVERTRPTLTRALSLREHDVVPELDLLTGLYDRQSFAAILGREIGRSRGERRPLFLLLLDVERLTTLNARIGRLAADAVLAAVAERMRALVGRTDYTFRLVGGRFAVVRCGGTVADAHGLYDEIQTDLALHPIGEAGAVSLAAGIAALLPHDDAASLAERADAALVDTKRLRQGWVANGG